MIVVAGDARVTNLSCEGPCLIHIKVLLRVVRYWCGVPERPRSADRPSPKIAAGRPTYNCPGFGRGFLFVQTPYSQLGDAPSKRVWQVLRGTARLGRLL